MDNDIIVEVIPQTEESKKIYDLDGAIFDLNSRIDLLISKADIEYHKHFFTIDIMKSNITDIKQFNI